MRNRKQYTSLTPLILASRSPRRAALLKEHSIPFIVKTVPVRERSTRTYPSSIVKELALKKARAASRHVKKGIVLGADTIVTVQGKVIGKPRSERDALRILRLINGKMNRVYTGVALIDAASGRELTGYEKSIVYMRKLPLDRLRQFARRHLDKAGAYAVQEKGDAFVRKVVGDYTNVVGLPVLLVKRMLKVIRSCGGDRK